MNSPANIKDPLVLFMPSGKRGRFPVGTPVLDAARQLGVYVESVCGGRATCGRCQIEVQEGNFAKHKIVSSKDHISPKGAKEERYERVRGLPEGRRLSCSAQILGDLVIDVPQDTVINAQVVRKAAERPRHRAQSAVQLCYVEVDEPDMHKPLGDLDRLKALLEKDWGWKDLLVAPHVIPQVQKMLRKGNWGVTAAIHRDMDSRGRSSSACGPASRTKPMALPATSARRRSPCIWCRCCRAESSRRRALQPADPLRRRPDEPRLLCDDEPGRARGHDRGRARGGQRADRQGLREGGVSREDIFDCVFVGNPIMHHLFLGIDPTELGQAPFALAVSGALQYWAHEIGIEVTAAHGSIRCPASPAMSGPTPPARRWPKARIARTG